MARVSPLNPAHEAYGALIAEYGPPGAGVLVPQVQRGVGAEYAAIRRAGTGAAILDQPQRGTIELRGGDRLSFLNRMVTQELAAGRGGKALGPWESRRAFWLNRKGRIDADLRITELGDRTLLDLDVFAVERTVATLSAFIIADDVELADRTEANHRLALHGQGAAALLAASGEHVAGPPVADIQPEQATLLRIAGAEVVVDRQDSTGDPGYELLLPTDDAAAVYDALARPDTGPEELENAALRPRPEGADRKAVRAGWHAYNIARIEAGWPLYMIDFGPSSLPHETGVLHDRVSFKKGCYLGQEVVARMESLGKPKQRLVALRIDAPPGGPEVVGGAAVFAAPDPATEVIGAVTSSAISPMLGSTPVCFAVVKTKHTEPGATLHVLVEGGGTIGAHVQDSLIFWSRR